MFQNRTTVPLSGTNYIMPRITEIDVRQIGTNSFRAETFEPPDSLGFAEGSRLVSNQFTFEFVRDLTVLEALEGEWNALFDRCGHCFHIFQTFNWCWHWCDVFLPSKESGDLFPQLRILTVREHGRLVSIWPLVVTKNSGLRCLTWLGAPVSQYGDVLAEDRVGRDDMLSASLQYLRNNSDVDLFQFWKVRKDALIFPVLNEKGAVVTQVQDAPYVNLAAFSTMEDYEKTLSKKRIKNRRRVRRKLDELGSLGFHTLNEGPDASKMIDVLLEFKRNWMRESGLVSSALDDHRTDTFFKNLAKDEKRKTGLELRSLSCGDDVAAMELGFRCYGRYVVHVITYNKAYQKYGAGTILSEHTIAELNDGGMEIVDFMAPGDGFKYEWCSQSVEVRDFAMPLSVRGRIWTRVYLGFLRERMKKLLAAMPAGFRKTITSMRRQLFL